MDDTVLDDGVVRLREWGGADDAAWYAACVRDPAIQRFTSDPPDLDTVAVSAAIDRMRASEREAGFVVCDARSGERLGNIALAHDGPCGEVSYWLAPAARGRGAATRALVLFTGWIQAGGGPSVLRLKTERDNTASQRVALRAGFHRVPERDGTEEIRGIPRPMPAFELPPPGEEAPTPRS